MAERDDKTTKNGPRQYKVRRGDTASKIAKEHGVDLATFAKWNGTSVKGLDKISPNQLMWVAEPYPGTLRNPGNVKNRGDYEGRDPKFVGKFAKFDTPEHGLNAAAQVINKLATDLQAGGRTNATPFSVINLYAPSAENDPEEHAKNITKEAGVGLYTPFARMTPKQKANFLHGLVRFETSKEAADWYRQADYDTAASLINVDPLPARETNAYGGNISPDDVKPRLFRDDKNKVTEYGTTLSIVRPGVGDQQGKFVIIPQIVDGELLSSDEAYNEYRMTGRYWGSADTEKEADTLAQRVHEDEAGRHREWWNNFLAEHPEELSEGLKAEIEESKKAETRQDAKGGDAGGEVTENAEIVNSGEAVDTPVTNGPRIVINPTTFRNGKDALCVAFNERFRIWMEAEGFNPQSEPTEKQREFFNDTAYADDELMLRRTILARIATLDTSVKDPTDAQIAETLEMLKGFRETERPDDAWQANALDRIIGLVQAVEPSVQPAAETASAAAQ